MLTQLKLNYLIITFMRVRSLITFLLALLAMAACGTKQTGPQLTGFTMGTSYSIQWSDDSDLIDKDEIKKKVNTRLEHINALMSTYIPDSELSLFNRSRDTGWHAVDIELATLVEHALSICKQSMGAFDVTVGPLV